MAKQLVIVESPAKAKTIGSYLGSDYKVVACMGHLRDLPKSVIGVDIENDFAPDYRPIKGKEDLIKELKKLSGEASMTFLATDPDREGEAISWHLQNLLKLDDSNSQRVTFNEITRNVVTDSIQHPRKINMDLVDAQQARRVLDRLVGYQLSPLLWRKIRRGLSAGRVQSVATKMVADREKEIKDFIPEEYWTLDIQLTKEEGKEPFTARYYGSHGKKKELHSEQEVKTVRAEAEKGPFLVHAVKKTEKQRNPSPPFTTSTMQQEASRKLNMTPRRTMAIAQQLYEGIAINGQGSVGLITYMRTDSLRISEDAIRAAKAKITAMFGKEYCPASSRHYAAKSNAQDAHEAIRPSDMNLDPESIRGSLTAEQYRLYRLIWSRFLASQMANAVYDSVAVEVEANGHEFRCNSSKIKFAGYTKVYEEGRDEDKEEKSVPLPEMTEGESLRLMGFGQEQHFTQPPTRYTDASLIRALEEEGIGRPSTYAPTVSLIQDREYVVKEGKYLRITPLGDVVTGLMEDKFSSIVDAGFTAQMEKQLDEVEEGEKDWKELIRRFYDGFSKDLSKAEEEMKGVYLKVPDEVSSEKCDKCGANMVIKTSRFGRFLACPNFPECTFTKPLVVEMPGRCPKCGNRIMKKTSHRGFPYYGCEKYPECDFMSWEVPTAEDCPSCGNTLFKKSGKGFKKPFCINPACELFLPEEKRGYVKKSTDESSAEKKTGKKTTSKKTAAKKTAAKKTTKKKTTKKTEK